MDNLPYAIRGSWTADANRDPGRIELQSYMIFIGHLEMRDSHHHLQQSNHTQITSNTVSVNFKTAKLGGKTQKQKSRYEAIKMDAI